MTLYEKVRPAFMAVVGRGETIDDFISYLSNDSVLECSNSCPFRNLCVELNPQFNEDEDVVWMVPCRDVLRMALSKEVE